MTTDVHAEHAETHGSFLSKQRIIAHPGFNRWLVPPAALAIHLCIGMAYGFSVFWLPLSKALASKRPSSADLKLGSSKSCSSLRAIGKFPPSVGCTPCSLCCSVHPQRCGAVG